MAALSDLKFAVRSLSKTPGFAATCLAVLSVGIAVSTSAFTVVTTAVKHPLPFPNSERLALVRERSLEKGFTTPASYTTFTNWREQGAAFQEVGGVEPRAFNLSSGNEPESVSGALATAGFFRSLGWTTVVGRGFTAEEERPGTSPSS